jgi:hypothetical protein
MSEPFGATETSTEESVVPEDSVVPSPMPSDSMTDMEVRVVAKALTLCGVSRRRAVPIAVCFVTFVGVILAILFKTS